MSVEPAEDIFAERAADTATAPAITRATDLAGVLLLKHENVYVMTDAFGDIHADARGLGLYDGDTRFLSTYQFRLNGARPIVLRTGGAAGYRGTLNLSNDDIVRSADDDDAELLPNRHALGVVRERLVAGDALRERIRLDNFGTAVVRAHIELRLDSDFADIFEIRGAIRPQRGERLPNTLEGSICCLSYRGLDGRVRRTRVRTRPEMSVRGGEGTLEPLTLVGDWQIDGGQRRTLEIEVWTETSGVEADAIAAAAGDPADDGAEGEASGRAAPPVIDEAKPAGLYRAWRNSTATLSTSHHATQRALDRGLDDLRLLVNEGPRPGERYIAAGVPWFATLFGRDSIITALQLLPYRPQLARETLEVLAGLQASEVDEWRDAEPGKIPHELRSGEMAAAGEIPHTPYYGTIDATPLWLLLLDRYERWTADEELVEQVWPNVLAALRWIDEFGDPDGDGFVEYRRHSRRGLANQGWKDSGDSVRFRDGRLAEGPIALVEVQAYVYAARRGVARLARRRGDEQLAEQQERAAEELRGRFEDAFWMDDAGTYALALDGSKRQVDAITSNPGHALWCGIASRQRAARVAHSLLSPPLWSGWGIRTLAADSVGYNPMGYHLGTVWPHDNGICAAGLARYGLAEEARRVAGALLESAAHFREARLPELFCGFDRSESPYPVPYPVACSPQAWAAGAPFHAMTALLGLMPNATDRVLELVAPSLPAVVPDLRVSGLRVRDAVVDLAFVERGQSTSVEVVRRSGEVDVVVRL